jgi:hypothetical protein
VSYAWYTFIGFVVVLIVGCFVSVVRNQFVRPEPVDPDLLVNPIRNYRLKQNQAAEEEELKKLNLDVPEA